MRRRSLTVAFALALLVPAAAFAQQGGGGRGGMGGGQAMGGLMAARNLMEQGNVEFLMSKAADLQLTAEQSTSLKVIAEKWTADTKEARDQVRPVLGQAQGGMGGMGGGGDMQAMRARLEQMAPHVQKMVDADRAAMDEAMKLLNDTQKESARRMVEQRNQPRRPGGF
jgi:hypothetical protein